MTCGCLHEKNKEHAKERWGWWFAGFGSGPYTVNGTFWSVALLYLSSLDATCDYNGFDDRSSGADGLACTPDVEWNEPLWLSFDGEACLHTVGLQTSYHNLDTETCQFAFEAYRNQTEYTCNCTESPYAFLPLRTRPTNILTISTIITNLVIAFILPVVGTWVDYSPYRRQLFITAARAVSVFTCLGCILAKDFVWMFGLIFIFSTAIWYELHFLGLAPYLPEICPTDADRGKIAGLRQVSSLVSQLIFLGIPYTTLLHPSLNLNPP